MAGVLIRAGLPVVMQFAEKQIAGDAVKAVFLRGVVSGTASHYAQELLKAKPKPKPKKKKQKQKKQKKKQKRGKK